MATDDRLPVTRDEQAVLDQLERLQQQIEAVRRKRREANDAFDAFLKSFGQRSSSGPRPAPAEPPPQVRVQPRTSDMLGERARESAPPPPAAFPIDAPPPAIPPPEALQPDIPAAAEPPPPAVSPASAAPVTDVDGPSEDLWPEIDPIPDTWEPEPSTAARIPHDAVTLPRAEPEAATILEESAEPAIVPAAAAPRRATSGAPVGLIALLAIVVVGAVGYFLWSSSSGEPDAAPPAVQTAPPPVQQAPPQAAPAPPPGPPPAAAEITTTRLVWVRVTVDGEKVREGEVPAGAKLPFAPQQVIVVRAGDAGAVRVSIGGVDQGVMGPEGIAVTKVYSIKP